jgi:antitoxin CptB
MISTLEHNRARWKCRRGLLELDIVLHRYLERNLPDRAFLELIELQDNDLWDIVIGRSERYGEHLQDAVARLRAA